VDPPARTRLRQGKVPLRGKVARGATAALFLVLYYYVKPHSLTVKHPAYSEMTAAAKKMKQEKYATSTDA